MFHPDVDSFKDIPRLPGDNYSEADLIPLPATDWCVEPPTWPTPPLEGAPAAEGARYPPPPHIEARVGSAHPPPKNIQHVFDDLKMTEQELDNILVLKGEI